MATIFFLVKFFENEEYADAFRKGRLFAHKLSYYRECEGADDERADRSEGVFEFRQADRIQLEINGIDMTADLSGPIEVASNLSLNLNLFCMYAAHSGGLDLNRPVDLELLKARLMIPDKCLDLGPFAVVVKNVTEYFRRIDVAAKTQGYEVSRGLVGYYDPDTFHGHFPIADAPFRKHDRFAHQQEYRFAFDTNADGPIILDIGDIGDITLPMAPSEINEKISLTVREDWNDR